MQFKILFNGFLISLFLASSVWAQEYLDLMAPREVSQDFVEYNNILNSIYDGNRLKKESQSFRIVNTSSFKKIIALNFFAAMYNPNLYNSEFYKNSDFKLSKELVQRFNYGIQLEFIPTYLFKKANYLDFDFTYAKYFLYDLYWAPYVFSGKISQIDTLDLKNTRHYMAEPYVLICEMQLTNNLNNYCTLNICNKKLRFALSPFNRAVSKEQPSWMIQPEGKENHLALVPKYLQERPNIELAKEIVIFINPRRLKVLEGTKDENLPYLYFNLFGIGGFPVVDNEIVNLYNYFGKSEKVNISDVKIILNSVLDEIYKWRK
ncbi:hypothetical protein JW960_00690 [candidate division KSB1 bacterium]|nr:hypothetical protein [candidate division KSB1 bacterium]